MATSRRTTKKSAKKKTPKKPAKKKTPPSASTPPPPPSSPVTKGPSTVKKILEFEGQVDKLRADLEEKTKALASSLTARQNELVTVVEDADTKYAAEKATVEAKFQAELDALAASHQETRGVLTTELDEVRAKLGISPEPETRQPAGRVNRTTGDGEIQYLDIKMPKKIHGKAVELGEGRDESFWNQLLQPQLGPNTRKKKISLDDYILLVCHNADEEDVKVPVILAAARAMGFTTKSSDPLHAVSARACQMKKQKKLLKRGRAGGWFLLTKVGEKLIERKIASCKTESAEPGDAGLDSFLFLAVSKADGPIDLSNLIQQVIANGYTIPIGLPMADFTEQVAEALKRLRTQNLIKTKKISGKEHLTLTAGGKRQSQALATA